MGIIHSYKGVILMLKRKVTVCFSIFLLMLILGWSLEHNIQSKNLVLPPSTDGYNVLSAKFTTPVRITTPFLPREYVRIIHRVKD